MNGYVLGGYVIVLGSIGLYALSLVGRIHGAKRRVGVVDGTSDRAPS